MNHESVNPLLLAEVQGFLRVFAREMGKHANAVLKITSGNYSRVTVSGRIPTPEAVNEVLQGIASSVSPEQFQALVSKAQGVQPQATFSRLAKEIDIRRDSRYWSLMTDIGSDLPELTRPVQSDASDTEEVR